MIKFTEELYEGVDKPRNIWVNPNKICCIRPQYNSEVYSTIDFEHHSILVRETIGDILNKIELWKQENKNE